MADDLSYVPVGSDADAAAYARVLAHSFGRAETESAGWIAKFRREDERVLKAGERVVAGLILIPMGQFFGGRSVPMTGIAAVGTAPESRGRGVALEMMKRCVRELAEAGVALSGLYPATQRLYRLAGYEQSGHRFEARVPLDRIGVRDTELDVRPLEEADRERVFALYRSIACHFDGNLDRAPIIWDRIERPPPSRTDLARAFVIEATPGEIEGYVFLTQAAPPIPNRGKHEVVVHDMLAATPRAARRLWTFLAAYATMAPEMLWCTGPAHPLLAMLSEQPYRLTHLMHWMTRILDVPKALGARGYAPGLRTAVRLEVSDPLISANHGAFTLEVREGAGHVERGGSSRSLPTLRATINGLATLYTGHLPAGALRTIGFVEGDDEAVRTAGAIFGGGTPWMSDMF